jgi:hypothetical protein
MQKYFTFKAEEAGADWELYIISTIQLAKKSNYERLVIKNFISMG